MMANVTIQLEAFRGQQNVLVLDASGSKHGSRARIVPREVTIPVVQLALQVQNVWLSLLENYQKNETSTFYWSR